MAARRFNEDFPGSRWDDGNPGMRITKDDYHRRAEGDLSAALDTGALIAVAQDEQEREELVDWAVDALRRDAGYDDEPDEAVAAGLYDQAVAVLQALGLLPEQEEKQA